MVNLKVNCGVLSCDGGTVVLGNQAEVEKVKLDLQPRKKPAFTTQV